MIRKCSFLAIAAVLIAAILPLAAVAEPTGRELFNDRCATCHSEDGTAKTTAGAKLHAANLHSKEVQSLSDAELYESIGKGTRHKNYPHAFLYKGFTEKQVHSLVEYIRTLK